jgi:hypothetical protein
MAPKRHPTPLSGGDRKALKKELSKSRAMTHIFAERSAEKRREGEALIREADNLACQSWNERMWSGGGPIDPSPTIDRAINGGYSWLEIKCSRCLTPRDVDLWTLRQVPTTCVHDLAGRLVCQKCKKAGKRPAATMLQLAPRSRQPPPEN